MAIHVPSIGKWYEDIADSRLFEIIAIDDYTANIDIKYEDGEYDDIDLNRWSQMAVMQTNPPQAWRRLVMHIDDPRRFTYAVLRSTPDADALFEPEPDTQFGWDEF